MEFLYLDEITSTNSYAKENIDKLKDECIVYTSKQTNGRGRFNRVWVEVGDKNLYLSIVVKPTIKYLENCSNLTQYTAVVLSKTFEEYKITPTIKWPNDILIDGKKISGILAESIIKSGEIKGIIIGVGINLNAQKEAFKAIDKKVTSLNLETNKEVDVNEFLNLFATKFFEDYKSFLQNGFSQIKEYYTSHINFLGKEISINNFNTVTTGIAKRLTKQGTLIILDNKDNQEKELLTGDILNI